MGCFGSRFDKRAGAVNHFTSGLQFVGGEAHEHNGHPVDHFVYSVVVEKDVDGKKVKVPAEFQEQFPTTDGKATDQAITEKIYTETHASVTKLLAEHTAAKGSDSKDPIVGGRYALSECIKQLTAVLAGFEASGIVIAAAAPVGDAPTGDVPAMDAPATDEAPVEMEGGEEGAGDMGGDAPAMEVDAAKAEAPAAMDPGHYDADDFAYGGWETVPAIFLKQATVNPYWGDLVKGNVIHWEFFQKKASDHTWSGAAGLITSFLASSTRADTESWFSGFLGDDDIASLTAIPADGAILFPGWVAGWKTEADAIAHIATLPKENAKVGLHGVVFHVTGASALAFAQCRLYAHRLEGKVSKNEVKDGNTHFEVAASPHNDQTIAEWVAAEAAAVAAAAAAKATPEPAAKDGAMDAPAMDAPAMDAPVMDAPAMEE